MTNGMSGGERGGGSGMAVKVGDTGWVHASVDHVFRDGSFMVRCGGDHVEEDLLPASDALPAVARWLAESPDAVHDLRSIAYDAQQFYMNGDDDEASVDLAEACRSLLNALTVGEGGAGGG